MFGEERVQKPPKRDHFMDAATPQKLKICDLTTTNAALMKLATIMYIHETFNLAETLEVNHRA